VTTVILYPLGTIFPLIPTHIFLIIVTLKLKQGNGRGKISSRVPLELCFSYL